jgi:O-antigen ligase
LPVHAVVDQTITSSPLDAAGVIAYVLLFGGVAAATFRRPSAGIAALISFVPFAFYHDVGRTTITFSKVALVAVALALLARRCDPVALRRPVAATLLVCGGLVFAATALSIGQALHRAPALRETFKSLQYLALFATVAVAAHADPDERLVRLAFAGTLAAVCVLALAQEVVGAPSGLWFLGHPIPRVAGPLEGPNQLAGYLGIGLAVVAAFALARGATPLELAALGLGGATLVLTISRAGVLASLAGLAVVVAVTPARTRRGPVTAFGSGLTAGAALLGAFGLALTHSVRGFDLLAHFSTLAEVEDPGAVGKRSQLWQAAMILWRRHPLLGIGAGNFELELGLAGFPRLRTHANSLYLQSLVEGGVPLLVATLALVVASVACFIRAARRDPLIAGALGAGAGLALHQVFDLLVFFPKVGELWWIVLALGAARVDAGPAERAKKPQS